MATVRISAYSLELCETLREEVMGRSRGRHEGRWWKPLDWLKWRSHNFTRCYVNTTEMVEMQLRVSKSLEKRTWTWVVRDG